MKQLSRNKTNIKKSIIESQFYRGQYDVDSLDKLSKVKLIMIINGLRSHISKLINANNTLKLEKLYLIRGRNRKRKK